MFDMAYILVFFGVLVFCIKPLGFYMAQVYRGRRVWLSKPLSGIEQMIYRVCGINPQEETGWIGYAMAVVWLGVWSFLFLFSILLLQGVLPLNPQHFPGLTVDLALNATISFITNTNWQSYSGEGSLSYFSQSVGLAVQNFLSAAVGMTVAVALFRSLSRKQTALLGNPYVDFVRSVLYILLPLSFVFALVLVAQGVVQNYAAYTPYVPLEAAEGTTALIAQGPVASQEAIKMLGSNGGGFFNANSAHPFENPTLFSNLLQSVALLLIPAALVYCFGVMVGDRRQGLALMVAMFVVFLPMLALDVYLESGGNPRLDASIVDQQAGNMEGKEQRFGVAASALWAVATTATSNGSVNAMHDSFTPLGGMIPMVMMQFGEIIFGGVGSGMYGMLVYVVLTVFIGGLMVGRTPEYLGKRLGAFEIQMASLCILLPAACVLVGTAIAVSCHAGLAGMLNGGAQGFSEVLYAASSASNNNGSAFAGLSANTPFYNVLLGILMLIGRYGAIFPVLALAGALADKNTVPTSMGTLPTHTPLFICMLVGCILLLGVLTYVPALALGPIAEHMHAYGLEIAHE